MRDTVRRTLGRAAAACALVLACLPLAGCPGRVTGVEDKPPPPGGPPASTRHPPGETGSPATR